MSISAELSKHLQQVYFGGNWTVSNLREHLSDIQWEEALQKPHGFNSIATLTCHCSYYVTLLIAVLKGEGLHGKDELSFAVPPIKSQQDWENLLKQVWSEVETAIALIGKIPDKQLLEDFTDPKYGNYFRNIAGIIQHMHYHLGQIVLIKKIIKADNTSHG